MTHACAVCVDVGSTFTKAALVELDSGRLVASASVPTTTGTDVMDGVDGCLDRLVAADPRAGTAVRLACSSAGGGLRIAVVGNEELVTAEAGRRVALSSGGTVVAVQARSRADSLALLAAAAPDVVLLTGGTDGGDAEAPVHCARAVMAAGWRGPVVVAGNRAARRSVVAVLDAAGVPYVVAGNVVPRIGVLAPESARAAIRAMFLSHVMGGKHLSARAEFLGMLRGPTPDVVRTGVELLARGLPGVGPGVGDVVVVDVGGATTDVHSVVDPDRRTDGASAGDDDPSREVVGACAVTRTVEGNLGLRASAVGTVREAGLMQYAEQAAQRRARPDHLPDSPAEWEVDEAIARAAVGVALRRHAGRARVVLGPDGRVVERTGIDLGDVGLVVGSGGVLRHGRPGVADRVLAASVGPAADHGWQLPRRAEVVVDTDCVLAAAGLLAAEHPRAAYRLLRRLWPPERPHRGEVPIAARG